jgi:hypothetical protein
MEQATPPGINATAAGGMHDLNEAISNLQKRRPTDISTARMRLKKGGMPSSCSATQPAQPRPSAYTTWSHLSQRGLHPGSSNRWRRLRS